ncbi:class I SAM-dependent rRNA methyltransferase [Tepidibacillus sp. LV47]|uniref:class I SAM-dependent rRNA methyltransferase n=1 Tax=Tepidibacillus sp. LV47 TaxID=3398228 RepID=UPI003AB0BB5F
MKNYTKIFLQRKRKKRLEQGHPWVFQSEVERIEGKLSLGELVQILNHQGVFLALGYANPKSQIIARVLSYDPAEEIDASFFIKRIQKAKEYRERFLPGSRSYRAVYGEADFLPGLIVDKYEDYLVVQILSYGMERLKSHILEGLLTVFQPKGIYLRNDVPVRELEGLQQETGVWYGEVPRYIEIMENDLRILVDVYEGQKTGHFFDQRENRAALKLLMNGWKEKGKEGAEVLDCFSHTGGFALHAAYYGAKEITAVDISELAIETAKRNAQLNGLQDRIRFEVANVFDFLREKEKEGRKYDVVILDPPAFAKSRSAVKGAYRGYKEINLRGMKLLREGGFLVTASCSYHMTPDLFVQMIQDAAFDAHKILRLVYFAGAGKDHPEIAGVDEGHYLKFAIYEVRSRG